MYGEVYMASSVGRPPKVQFHTSVDLPKSGMFDHVPVIKCK